MFHVDRRMAKGMIDLGCFRGGYASMPHAVGESCTDKKDFYSKRQPGKMAEFTGISSF